MRLETSIFWLPLSASVSQRLVRCKNHLELNSRPVAAKDGGQPSKIPLAAGGFSQENDNRRATIWHFDRAAVVHCDADALTTCRQSASLNVDPLLSRQVGQ